MRLNIAVLPLLRWFPFNSANTTLLSASRLAPLNISDFEPMRTDQDEKMTHEGQNNASVVDALTLAEDAHDGDEDLRTWERKPCRPAQRPNGVVGSESRAHDVLEGVADQPCVLDLDLARARVVRLNRVSEALDKNPAVLRQLGGEQLWHWCPPRKVTSSQSGGKRKAQAVDGTKGALGGFSK